MKSLQVGQRGGATLKFFLSIPVMLILIGVMWFVLSDQWQRYWDRRVVEMCKKYGEPTVFLRVGLVHEGAFEPTPDERYADSRAAYVSRWKVEIIRPDSPKVTRSQVSIVRALDKKILGQQEIYSRVGGDPGFVDNPSSFSCRDVGIQSLESQVFFKFGESK